MPPTEQGLVLSPRLKLAWVAVPRRGTQNLGGEPSQGDPDGFEWLGVKGPLLPRFEPRPDTKPHTPRFV